MPPTIWHDTQYIVSANPAALELFRVEEWEIIDRHMTDGVAGEEMQALARLRLKTIYEYGELPARIFAFLRHDGTHFQARVKTTKDGDLYKTEFEYLGEY